MFKGTKAIQYTLSFSAPSTHLFHVEIQVKTDESYTDFIMPAWAPGSYRIRDFAKNVQEFTANHTFKKIDKSRWRVFGKNPAISYKVYAFELSVRTSHLDDTHAYINGTSVFMYSESQRSNPCILKITKPFKSWKVATSLEAKNANTYAAPNYDVLADSPIEISEHNSFSFKYRGRKHTFVFCGDGNYSEDRLMKDSRKIIREASSIFGDIPYKNYTFIVHLTPGWGGGLEHANSTSLQFGFLDFEPHSKYVRFAKLVAHEFFHLWNVKRIVPEKFFPYDYEKECFSELLWLMEGFTDYYAHLLVVRAGITSTKEFFESLANMIKQYEETPGKNVQSLKESSFDAWIKFYQPNEHSVNSTISYYLNGLLVGLCLDLYLRKLTRNKIGLDECMYQLYDLKKPLPEEAFQTVVENLSGHSFEKFFNSFISGVEKINFNKFLRYAGLTLEKKIKKDEGKALKNKPYLGVTVNKQPDKIIVTSVLAGTPAMEYGLSANDEIVAIDGYKSSPEIWDKYLNIVHSGDYVCFTLFRNHKIRHITVKLGKKDELDYKITPRKRLSRLERLIGSWINSHASRTKKK